MFINSKFTINGYSSDSIGAEGVLLVRTDKGTVEEQMFGDRSLISSSNPKTGLKTLYGMDQDVIEFDIKITNKMGVPFTKDTLREIARAFGSLQYQTFTTDEYPGVEFYVATTSMKYSKTPENTGWIEIHLKTSAPHAYTVEVVEHHIITNPPEDITINNPSNVMNSKYNEYYYEPEFMKMIMTDPSDDACVIQNVSDDYREFGFINVDPESTFTINNQLRMLSGEGLINNLIDYSWFRLVEGNNILRVNNSMEITIKAHYPVYI